MDLSTGTDGDQGHCAYREQPTCEQIFIKQATELNCKEMIQLTELNHYAPKL